MGTTKAAKLKTAIQAYLQDIRDMNPVGDDEVADAGVWIGDEVKERAAYSKTAAAIFHFDGAGYHLFSESGDYAYYGIHTHRNAIFKLGEDHGFDVEPETNWSIAFYA